MKTEVQNQDASAGAGIVGKRLATVPFSCPPLTGFPAVIIISE